MMHFAYDSEMYRIYESISEAMNRGKMEKALLAAAVGSALGHAVETGRCPDIDERFGEAGFRENELDPVSGKAAVTGDFMEMLFVCCALLAARAQEIHSGETADMQLFIRRAVDDYARCCADGGASAESIAWISRLPGVCVPRSRADEAKAVAAANGRPGSGCMLRALPIALFCRCCDDLKEPAALGMNAAAITHGNPKSGRYTGAFAHLLCRTAWRKTRFPGIYVNLLSCREDMKQLTHGKWTMNINWMWHMSSGMDREAPRRAPVNLNPNARSALRLAVSCAQKYPLDFSKTITEAARHGSIVGAMAGCMWALYCGIMGPEKEWLDKLEVQEVICELAGDIHGISKLKQGDSLSGEWECKYISCRPAGGREDTDEN